MSKLTSEAKALKKRISSQLPEKVFRRYTPDLFYFGSFWGLSVAAGFIAVSSSNLWVHLVCGIIIGTSWGTLSHLTHNILHGTVVGSRRLQNMLAFLGFLQHLMPPTFYRYWHNYLHHGFTQRHIVDPDAYPSTFMYKSSKFFQKFYKMLPGSGTFLSYFYFFHSFTTHGLINMFYQRYRMKQYRKINHRRVNIEFILQAIILLPVLFFLAKANFLLLVILPYAICNYMIMSYIATNHALSPLTRDLDSLANTVSVKSNPISDFLCRYMGHHVCHHIYPNMNPRYYRLVHEILMRDHKENYRYINKWTAIKLLYSTPRIYHDDQTLVNPDSNQTFKISELLH